MIRKITPLWVGGALLAMAAPATAQGAAELCKLATTLQPGEWVEYELSGQGTAGMTSMRYANVGTEDVGGTPHHWYEIQVSGAQSVTSQLLVPGRLSDIADVKEMVVQMGNQPPMEFTGEMLRMAQQNMQMQGLSIDEECEGAQVIGQESVTVGAGTFEATHLLSTDREGHFWLSPDVPFGIIRARTVRGEMTLLRYGNGAESSIVRQ